MESNPADDRGLFRLPRNLRDDIYRRVLVIPHPLNLFAEGGSHKVELFVPGPRPRHWSALLSTNHQIHDEAIKILYGSHQFVLVDTSRGQATLLQSFLSSIGSINASHLRHICINFPAVDKGSEEAASSSPLREEDLRGLKLLQDMCGNLTTLEAYVHDKNSRGLVVTNGHRADSISPDDTKRALAEVETQFRAISSLRKVVVQRYDGPLKPEVEELMQSFGWVVVLGR
ncbi:hypothetical protein QBC39DRAFT_348226 [Podospora conica]|nr:hypothetical protein QBC39DRAFT_348226 [Schizothecium conicum]